MKDFARSGPPKEWSKEDKELIDWFLALPQSDYPKTPFYLRPGVRIIDFFTVLKEEIARGPEWIRAKNGVLQDDIKDLRKVVESSK